MKPQINITPLIDVLLVLLIIFMVISPLKPKRFEAMIPREPTIDSIPDSRDSLVVQIKMDSTLELNGNTGMGTIDDPTYLIEKLTAVFSERTRNNVVNNNLTSDPGSSAQDRIQKAVFIKAPKTLSYGRVVKLIDTIKIAGANPIGLQIDLLE